MSETTQGKAKRGRSHEKNLKAENNGTKSWFWGLSRGEETIMSNIELLLNCDQTIS